MPEQRSETCLPSATWFLFAEEDAKPLGQIFRSGDSAVPTVGEQVTLRGDAQNAVVVDFTELRATCAIRRFRVVVRMVD